MSKSVRVLDNNELPGWVHEVLSMGSKHPIRDKFNETQFLADIDIFLSQLKNKKTYVKLYLKEKPRQRHMQKT